MKLSRFPSTPIQEKLYIFETIVHISKYQVFLSFPLHDTSEGEGVNGLGIC
nr:MAG TPA: hypothetical protein [Inoviridae sp.]